MSLNVRRVVTGHDEQGRAVVLFDDAGGEVVSKRPRHQSAVMWSTDRLPANNDGEADAARRAVGTFEPGGSVFRIIRFEPGNTGRDHRTDSLDYVIILEGAIDLDLDGQTVHLRRGDVVVQRGTMHNWVNRGSEPCVMAVVLIGAEPVQVAGRTLETIG